MPRAAAKEPGFGETPASVLLLTGDSRSRVVPLWGCTGGAEWPSSRIGAARFEESMLIPSASANDPGFGATPDRLAVGSRISVVPLCDWRGGAEYIDSRIGAALLTVSMVIPRAAAKEPTLGATPISSTLSVPSDETELSSSSKDPTRLHTASNRLFFLGTSRRKEVPL
jgi:hypothetical protein